MTRDELLKLRAMQALERSSKGLLMGNSDVDTLDMGHAGGTTNRVRIQGVDGPEADQPFGEQAGQGLKQIIGDQQVRREDAGLEHFGRNVSRLTTEDGRDVGSELISQGLAAVPPAYGDENPAYRAGLQRLEAEAKKYGRGMWNPLNKNPEMPWDQRNRKAREEGRARGVYTKQTTILDDIGGTLDYVGNVSRSTIAGLADPKGTALQFAAQAIDKKRSTDGTQLKDSLTKNLLGIRKPVRFGEDGNGFDVGDIADVALDTGLAIVTDPLTYLFAGPITKGLAKGATAIAGGLGAAEKTAQVVGSGAARTTIGGIYGAGAMGNGGEEDETTIGKRLGGAALGGIAAGFMPFVGKGLSGAARTMTNSLTDSYMRITKGAENFSELDKAARTNVDKAMNNSASSGMRFHANVLNKLETPDQIQFAGFQEMGKTWEVGRRNTWKKSNPNATDVQREQAFAIIRDESQKRHYAAAQKLGEQYAKSAQGAFEESRLQIEKVNKIRIAEGEVPLAGFGVYWPDLFAADAGFTEVAASASFADHKLRNARSMIRQQSHLVMAVEAYAKSGKVGLSLDDANNASKLLNERRYVENVAEWDANLALQPRVVKDFIENYLSGKLKVPDEFLKMGIDNTQAVYNRQFGWHTIDKIGRKAIEDMADIMNRPIGFGEITGVAGGVATRRVLEPHWVQGAAKAIEPALRAWDIIQTSVVRNQLFFGASWLKNNYWENSLKAYMSGGLAGLMDSTMYNAVRKETWNDIFAMTSGKGSSIVKSADANDLAKAVELGVVSNPSARALGSSAKDDVQKFMYSPMGLRRAAQREAEKDGRNLAVKVVEGWGDMLAGSVGRLGSTLENNSRYMAWARMRNSMRQAKPEYAKNPKISDWIDHTAAEAIKRTFYDYSDISAFNRLVTKRIFPFAAYYMKNIPYYINAAFDVTTVGNGLTALGPIGTPAMRTLTIEKAIRHFGDDPTENDKAGMNDFLLGNRPRILGRDKEGMTVGVMPAFSRDDALRMTGITHPLEMGKAYLDKMNPMIKAPLEVMTGYDSFTGSPLVPSALKKKRGEDTGSKYLFGRGFAGHYTGMPVDVDERGNPYTQSDAYARLDKLRSAFLPMPGVEAVAAVVGQAAHGKRDLGSGIWNKFFAPLQEVDLSKRMSNATKARNKAKKKDDDNE